jgi:mannose-1-phosphate guanylyltransferase/mannose-6-phosphate isomerase
MPAVEIQPVILCGGSGTRLWPLSRAQFPKQFLSLFGKESLFQLTVDRLSKFPSRVSKVAAPLVVGNEEHRFLMLDQLQAMGVTPTSVLLEPVGRNTAPALTIAALAAQEHGADPVLIVSPADQLMLDIPAFISVLEKAVLFAAEGAIVTFGILPDRPETGYGYIHAAKGDAPKVMEFVEKPNRETAQRYIDQGNYYWNSGIFVLRASVWLKALAEFRPDMASAVKAAWDGHHHDADFIRPDRVAFEAIAAESIDYAVMEKCSGSFDLRMLPLAAGWSDLGSWDSAWQSAEKDTGENASVGDAMIEDCRGVFVHASSRLVSVVGLNDVVVVETPDAVMVTSRARSQDVKKIVESLGERLRVEHTHHRKVYRPWGWYDSVDEGPGFKVKRIMVKPGARLSLQKHVRRAEHWVVVSGTAEVTCGEMVMQLTANQSTYIPLGVIHRLANPGTMPLEIIEVQSGDYLGEDDIVRLDDQYGRLTSAI